MFGILGDCSEALRIGPLKDPPRARGDLVSPGGELSGTNF